LHLTASEVGFLHRYSTAVQVFPMEFAALAGLLLFLSSEVISYLPIRENGVLQAILGSLQKAFPKPDKDAFIKEEEEKEEE